MKPLVIFLLPVFILVFTACTPGPEKCPDVDFNREMSEISLLLEKYELAREGGDFITVEQIWAPDTNIILFGTEGEEQLVGIDAILKAMKRQFSEFQNTFINISDQKIQISRTGQTAWFSQVLDYNFIYQGNNVIFEDIRFTGVLEKRDGKWMMVQGHLSVPYEADIGERTK
jgi:hypothetical protein